MGNKKFRRFAQYRDARSGEGNEECARSVEQSMSAKQQEAFDILSVKEWSKAVRVEDPDAVNAFKDGRGVFDVHPNGLKLSSFFEKHPALRAKAQVGSNGYPSANVLSGGRSLYIAVNQERLEERFRAFVRTPSPKP